MELLWKQCPAVCELLLHNVGWTKHLAGTINEYWLSPDVPRKHVFRHGTRNGFEAVWHEYLRRLGQ